LGYPDLDYPDSGYKARSVTMRGMIEWNEAEKWVEAFRIVEESGVSEIGSSLYLQIPSFADFAFLFDAECAELIDAWSICKTYNVPLAPSLDEVPARKIEAFKIIEAEMNAVSKYKAKMK
jgi:hypothetical protein